MSRLVALISASFPTAVMGLALISISFTFFVKQANWCLITFVCFVILGVQALLTAHDFHGPLIQLSFLKAHLKASDGHTAFSIDYEVHIYGNNRKQMMYP